MGLGGYLTWTAAVREIVENSEKDIKIMPVEANGNAITKIVKSPVFKNNPNITYEKNHNTGYLQLNHPATNYCTQDSPERAIHVQDKHIIENICEKFGIADPKLKCELFFDDDETAAINALTLNLSKDYIAIEPHSKMSYTKNRVYPFEKWQSIVDQVSNHAEVVQVGAKGVRLLKNVTDMTGMTSFRQAAGIIGNARLFLSSEGGLVHAATAVDTKSVVVITGYQSYKMVAYPQNINVYIGDHGPCGMKVSCPLCQNEANSHDHNEIIKLIEEYLG